MPICKGFFVEDDFSVVDIIPLGNEEKICEFDIPDFDSKLDEEEEKYFS